MKPTPESIIHTVNSFTISLNSDKTISSCKDNFRNSMQHQQCQRHSSSMSHHAINMQPTSNAYTSIVETAC